MTKKFSNPGKDLDMQFYEVLRSPKGGKNYFKKSVSPRYIIKLSKFKDKENF